MITPIELQTQYSKIVKNLSFHIKGDGNNLSFNEQVKKEIKGLNPKVGQRLHSEFFGWGPLEELFAMTDVTEILINGPESIYYEKDGQFQYWPQSFLSKQSYEQFIYRFCEASRVHFNLDRPCSDGHWDQYRVHLIAPPLSQDFVKLSLRRHPISAWTFKDLEDLGWASQTAIEFLVAQIKKNQNLLIVGPTGVGKTSVISACLQQLNEQERTVIIEDTDELSLPNDISLKLLTREDNNQSLTNYGQCELIIQAMRMRPHRLVLGEVRGMEAKDLMLALSTGHKGSLGSLHAEDARQALWRLEMLVQMGAPQWSLTTIRSLMALSLDYIVTLKQENGKRQMSSIHRIASVESCGLTLEKIF